MKISTKKNLKDCTKWIKKFGGRSFVITCGVIGTLYQPVNSNEVVLADTSPWTCFVEYTLMGVFFEKN